MSNLWTELNEKQAESISGGKKGRGPVKTILPPGWAKNGAIPLDLVGDTDNGIADAGYAGFGYHEVQQADGSFVKEEITADNLSSYEGATLKLGGTLYVIDAVAPA